MCSKFKAVIVETSCGLTLSMSQPDASSGGIGRVYKMKHALPVNTFQMMRPKSWLALLVEKR